MKHILWILFVLGAFKVSAQSTPVFNGKQMIYVSTIAAWDFTARPAGWYRIGKISGGYRGNATFELREDADHSTVRFQIGVNFNNKGGSSFTLTSHSYYDAPTFTKLRLLTRNTYDDVFLEVFVDPHNNNGFPFYNYLIDPLANGDWEVLNWTLGAIPTGYNVAEYNLNKLLSVGNILNNNILTVGRDGNVGIGTASPNAMLAVNGNIRAKEVKVETANWPDYVFAKNYELPSLQSTEQHIKDKGHLPGIPSGADVQANGVNLGEMNAKLLQKIEELTLYLIDMKKDATVQKEQSNQQINLLKKDVEKLKTKNK